MFSNPGIFLPDLNAGPHALKLALISGSLGSYPCFPGLLGLPLKLKVLGSFATKTMSPILLYLSSKLFLIQSYYQETAFIPDIQRVNIFNFNFKKDLN